MKKIVLIPTYNEKENIASIIDAVLSFEAGYHILVIDDGSPDGTANIVRDIMQIMQVGFLLNVGLVNWVWELPIFMGLNGRFRITIHLFTKWMPIFLTIQLI